MSDRHRIFRLAARATFLALALCFAATPTLAVARDAYVSQGTVSGLTVIDTETNLEVGEIDGAGSFGLAITPDGERIYAASPESDSVIVTDSETNEIVDSIVVGGAPGAVAISPDGSRAYTNGYTNDTVSAIDTETGEVIGEPIDVGADPRDVAISPDGSRVYTANLQGGSLSVIDTATEQVVDTVEVCDSPYAIGVTPDGARLYVGCLLDDIVVVSTQTGEVVGDPILGTSDVQDIAITADGSRVYAPLSREEGVAVISTASDRIVGDPIAVGDTPVAAAITPDMGRGYVGNLFSEDVQAIDTAAGATVGDPIETPSPSGIAITPNQSPTAELSVDPIAVETGEPVDFDASASTDDEGIESYAFDYGDGDTSAGSSATRRHAYAEPGTYTATVTVDDGDDCEGFVFTGQTASCNGPSEVTSEAVEIVVTDPVDPPEPTRFDLGFRLDRPLDSLRSVTGAISCRGSACEAEGSGKLVIRGQGGGTRKFDLLGSGERVFEAGESERVSLGIPAAARQSAREALRSGGVVRARTRAVASDGVRERVEIRAGRIRG